MNEAIFVFLGKVLAWGGGLLLLGLAIFVHEFGHYLAARLLGFKVEVFSIGFGPAVWQRTVKGIKYKIGWIPFGGYVALPQLDPSGMERLQGGMESERENLPDTAPWKRMIVSVAGPFGNVVLAVVLAYLIFWVPGSGAGNIIDTRVGTVEETSEAWKEGLRIGDRIVSVNGEKVDNWVGLMTENALSGGKGTVMLAFERDGQTQEIEVPVQKDDVFGVHMLDGVYPKATCMIAGVSPDSPAAKAGLLPGDVLRTVDGQPIWGAGHFISLIQKKGETLLTIGISRGKEEQVKEMTPQYNETLGRALVGIQFDSAVVGSSTWMMYTKPWDQLKGDASMVVRLLKALTVPKNKDERKVVVSNVSGPFMILDELQKSVRHGPMDALGFLRMICINLAILNLLPIPVLDGGHIVFALYEVITRRKPHPRVVAALVNVFAVLLIGLMVFLVGRDIVRKAKTVRRDAERQQMLQEKDGE